MKKIKVLTVFGTRPEAIKMAPVLHRLNDSPYHQSVVCVTGQHRQMLDQMVRLFEIKVDYDLQIMMPNQTLANIASKVISQLDEVIAKEQPDWLLVQGDTSTCFAAGLVAFYNKVKVGHIEAGLRTFDLDSPFPEEANRQLVSRITDLHFAPTSVAQNNLLAEGISADHVIVSGNTVIDALLWVRDRIQWKEDWNKTFGAASDVLKEDKRFILVTGHRRENHGQGFINLCNALKQLACRFQEWNFIYPVHLNPNVKQPVYDRLSGLDNIHLIDPLGYEQFVYLLDKCQFVLTDSGGIQEEAPSLGKPVLVMRDSTERPEGVDAGSAKLVGTCEQTIVDEVSLLIEDLSKYLMMARAVSPFGDGHASQRIVDCLI